MKILVNSLLLFISITLFYDNAHCKGVKTRPPFDYQLMRMDSAKFEEYLIGKINYLTSIGIDSGKCIEGSASDICISLTNEQFDYKSLSRNEWFKKECFRQLTAEYIAALKKAMKLNYPEARKKLIQIANKKYKKYNIQFHSELDFSIVTIISKNFNKKSSITKMRRNILGHAKSSRIKYIIYKTPADTKIYIYDYQTPPDDEIIEPLHNHKNDKLRGK